MRNTEIAQVFEQIALLLDLKGEEEHPYRIRAYERAVQTVTQSRYELKDIYEDGGIKALIELPGIGKEIALKIEELLKMGSLAYLENLKKKLPSGIFEIMEIEGMGPKRTAFLWKKFHVGSLPELAALAQSGELEKEKGWGKKSVEKILSSLELKKTSAGRLPYDEVKPVADRLIKTLKKAGCTKIDVAGSLRRAQPTVGDIDILATHPDPMKAMEAFCTHPDVISVHAKGPTKSSVALSIGIDADLRIVDPEVYGAALQYFTGNKDHNVRLRKLAIRKGFTISEYGVYRGSAKRKKELVASETEEDVYHVLGLPYIPPEARLDRGEIEAAMEGEKALKNYLKNS